ncbi:MAG: phage portal protein [Ruminococcus sp.]|nr:phage portal protein [Ruminococcus sp.]
MKMGLLTSLRHGWNAFLNRDPTGNYVTYNHTDLGMSSTYRPDRTRLTKGNERTIITSIFNKIALDVADITITHCKVDGEGRYLETINSSLNNCLNLEANLDQTGRAFIQDIVMSMLDEGYVAIVPTDTSIDPTVTDSYNIESMRTGKILEWYPQHVRVNVYNEKTGRREDITLPKKMVAIIENPLYAVINEPNSTMQRLIRKLALLDAVDERTSSGKLDMIIQLPYSTKHETRRQHAEKRRNDIMDQIKGPMGIAYVDSTEKIIQLNRPLENNLLKQIEYLTNQAWSQLGMTQGILDGTADEQAMMNYEARVVEPFIAAIVDEMKRKFLTKTARTRGQSIKFFRAPFKLVPISSMAELADKLTRNEVLTSNEVRQELGFKPSKDPNADKLQNSNLNHPEQPPNDTVPADVPTQDTNTETGTINDEQNQESGNLMDMSITDLMRAGNV